MTNTTANFNTAEQIGEIVPHVFDTMLGLRAAAATASLEPPRERVSGAIGIAGRRSRARFTSTFRSRWPGRSRAPCCNAPPARMPGIVT